MFKITNIDSNLLCLGDKKKVFSNNNDIFIPSISLINKNRIDVIIGIEYVNYYDKKLNTQFFEDMYVEHKRAFNNLIENNCKGREAFISRFNNLIESTKNEGNNRPIPVFHDKDKLWLCDGFHRTSILIYYGLDSKVCYKNLDINNSKSPYYPTDINFFKIRGLHINYCNYTMMTYLKYYLKNFSCIIIFPNDKLLSTELSFFIKQNFIYDLNINNDELNPNLRNTLISYLYENEEWCLRGRFTGKSYNCFNRKGNLRIIFIEKTSLENLKQFKNRLRMYYNIGNHSVHIPDTQKECNNMLDLLNINTLRLYSRIPSIYAKFSNFNRLFTQLKDFCDEKNIDTKHICITSSSVLSVYGIRDCGDMDLFIAKDYEDIFKKTKFDNDNNYTLKKHYPYHFEDIIYNPNNHFLYRGIKFATINIIYTYKVFRIKNKLYGNHSIQKDINDVMNIEKLFK